MSYDIDLLNDEGICQIPPHKEGGTYCMGGNSDASLNITYNYSKYFYEQIDKDMGIRWLYGKKAKDTVERLRAAVGALGTSKHRGPFWTLSINSSEEAFEWFKAHKELDWDDPANKEQLEHGIEIGALHDGGGYWKPTPGNAGYALSILLKWALLHPEGVWSGD